METAIIKLLDLVAEFPLKVAEKSLKGLQPGFGWRPLVRAAIIALFLAMFASLFIHLELILGHFFPDAFRKFAHEHPASLIVGLVLFPLSYIWQLRVEYREGRKNIEEQITGLRTLVQEVKGPLVELVHEPQEQATEFVRNALVACKDYAPIEDILNGLTPSNTEIVNKLDLATKETHARLALLSRLTQLPPSARDTLSNFLTGEFLEQPWGPLYVTFAIQLQLEPWIRHRSPRYVFVRDMEEVACHYSDPGDAKIAFRDNLEKDLEAILRLVNGTLWSVMYKDITVWNQRSYGDSNKQLLERTKGRGTDLRRLFIYKRDWFTDRLIASALTKSAQWHQENKYPSRYMALTKEMAPLVEDNQTFVSSCLINETRIMIYQIFSGQNSLEKQKYRCDAEAAMVADYKLQFESYWEAGEALAPAEFLSEMAVTSGGSGGNVRQKEPDPNDLRLPDSP